MTEIVAKRPNSKRNLDMAIRRLGKTDEDFIQARTIMANAIVAQMIPSGAVKGGYALKLRFGNMQARATVDLDAARACEPDAFMAEFEKRLVSGWEGFEGRVVPRDPAQPEGVPAPYVMMPFDVKLSYLKSPWCTVPFELGHNEIGDADEPDFLVPEDAQAILSALGFPSLSPIPVMPLHHQIAQKIHALSTPGSKRAHDLIDLQLIVLNNPLDYGLVKTTCQRLFAYRRLQLWPPVITKGEGWESLYAQQLLPEPINQDLDGAICWVNNLIQEIDNA